MPYNSGQHWILEVIDPWDDSVIYFNPLGNESGDGFKDLITTALNDWKVLVGSGMRQRRNWQTLIDTVRYAIQEESRSGIGFWDGGRGQVSRFGLSFGMGFEGFGTRVGVRFQVGGWSQVSGRGSRSDFEVGIGIRLRDSFKIGFRHRGVSDKFQNGDRVLGRGSRSGFKVGMVSERGVEVGFQDEGQDWGSEWVFGIGVGLGFGTGIRFGIRGWGRVLRRGWRSGFDVEHPET
ncbi:hypothetical protein TIFTF001_034149 [Ficus carica]|uniref:Uncharacterized protein n=1 Tax=Ficus carica TaxID=3494 RepID=A0AA88E005_FICCA|nr:hypothetical protein TIFTF001_034149 [Ficus carica]